MRLVLFLLRRARALFLLSGLFSILGGITTAGLLISINFALSHRAKGPSLILPFLILAIATMIFRTVGGNLLAGLSQNALLQLRMELSEQILNTPLRRLEETGSSRILAVLTEDIPNIANFISILPILCTNAVTAVTCLIYMSVISPKLLGLTVLFLAIGVGVYEYLKRMADGHLISARDEHTKLVSQFKSLIDGMKELKLHRKRRETFMTEEMHGTASRFQGHMLAGLRTYTGAASLGELLMFLAIGLIIFVPLSAIRADQGIVASFVLTMLYLVGPLEAIINSIPQLSRANVALTCVTEIGLKLSSTGSSDDKSRQSGFDNDFHSLEMRDVMFEYRSESEEKFALGPLNLLCSRGEIVFFIGGNGGGKTTLAKLLVGLYKPDSGSILVNQQRVTDEKQDDYRQMFSAVFADFHLFDTLLGLSHPGLDERANRYLDELKLRDKVRIESGALSTVDLSHGQRKRLALLTAYLEDRPIYLFDEWAADQDPSFKQIFYYRILPDLKARGKTVFVISHDDSYFHVADRLMKLDFGKVTEEMAEPIMQ